MIWVLDASAAVEIVLGRKHSQKLLGELLAAESIITPELFLAEIANVFWKYFRFEKMSREDYFFSVNKTLELIDEFSRHSEILDVAVNIAIEHKVTVYDALYLGLAANMKGRGIITLDKKVRLIAHKMEIKLNKL